MGRAASVGSWRGGPVDGSARCRTACRCRDVCRFTCVGPPRLAQAFRWCVDAAARRLEASGVRADRRYVPDVGLSVRVVRRTCFVRGCGCRIRVGVGLVAGGLATTRRAAIACATASRRRPVAAEDGRRTTVLVGVAARNPCLGGSGHCAESAANTRVLRFCLYRLGVGGRFLVARCYGRNGRKRRFFGGLGSYRRGCFSCAFDQVVGAARRVSFRFAGSSGRRLLLSSRAASVRWNCRLPREPLSYLRTCRLRPKDSGIPIRWCRRRLMPRLTGRCRRLHSHRRGRGRCQCLVRRCRLRAFLTLPIRRRSERSVFRRSRPVTSLNRAT